MGFILDNSKTFFFLFSNSPGHWEAWGRTHQAGKESLCPWDTRQLAWQYTIPPRRFYPMRLLCDRQTTIDPGRYRINRTFGSTFVCDT